MARRKAPREVEFQQDLYYVLRQYVESHHDIAGLRVNDVRIEYPAGDGRVDIVVLGKRNKPVLIIETKRKSGAIQKDIDPLSPRVIQQAIMYAAMLGSPYFATANAHYMAVFRIPEPGEQFEVGRHRVLVEKIGALNQEFVGRVLTRIAEYDASSRTQRERVATSIDWAFIIRLRSFVDWLYRRILPGIGPQLETDGKFRRRLADLEKQTGVSIEPKQLAREMAYILANKVLFYKGLERAYKDLPKLSVKGSETMPDLLDTLSDAWEKATVVTEDFEAIFSARLYDCIPLTDKHHDLFDVQEGIQGFIEDMERYQLESMNADVIGHVYEDLIPPEERHALGQFYTPPSVAEFLARWSIRSGDDSVLDPSSGSGTFLVKAYQRLAALKEQHGLRQGRGTRHRELLTQVYGVDINPFPAQLTAMNLAMRDLLHPVSEMNVLERDFFQVAPGQTAMVPYKIKMPTGEKHRQIKVPFFDVVLANPPYTRWTELSDTTKTAINRRLSKYLKKYGLVAVVRGGIETALYHHFVLSTADFLKDGGRCGMIISNSWLSTDVGIKFSQFLLDHFKIHAVIDLGPRIFPVPLVAANMLLLERCKDKKQRDSTRSVFAYVDEPLDIDDYVRIVQHPEKSVPGALVRAVKQDDLPKDKKWIDVLFGDAELEAAIHANTVPLGTLFEVTRGTIQYCAEHSRNLGANTFFYLDDARVQQFTLKDPFVRPTLPGAKDAPFFTVSSEDWRALRKAGKDVYAFHAHAPRDDLPKEVKDYIRWGETRCRNKNGDACSEAGACKERAKKKEYYGWYDIGTVSNVSFFVPYYTTYRPRFIYANLDLALGSDVEACRPLAKLTDDRVRAACGILNSSIVQLQLELSARITGGGALGIERRNVADLRIPDVASMPKPAVHAIAAALDGLEAAARRLGAANRRGSAEKLEPEYGALDDAVAKAMGLNADVMERVRTACVALVRRRTSRAPEPQPEFMRGSVAAMPAKPKTTRKRSKQKDEPSSTLLDYASE